MYTEPRAARLFCLQDFRRGPVIVAVIRLKLKTDENTHCHFLLAAVCVRVLHDQWPAYFDDVRRKFRI